MKTGPWIVLAGLALGACGPERPTHAPPPKLSTDEPSLASSARRAGRRLVDARDATHAVAAAVLDDATDTPAPADDRGKHPD